ncbi:hypothetical protein GCM10009539_41280 [Cryptosporangium japonicum]|uniref:Uncharacterized protein n=1 Tax=Cryptosporangium japonicum TaxID=80872 RepID=A0ABN0UIL1_9ACTN
MHVTRGLAATAGLALMTALTVFAAAPAQAVPECAGFTEAQAAAIATISTGAITRRTSATTATR